MASGTVRRSRPLGLGTYSGPAACGGAPALPSRKASASPGPARAFPRSRCDFHPLNGHQPAPEAMPGAQAAPPPGGRGQHDQGTSRPGPRPFRAPGATSAPSTGTNPHPSPSRGGAQGRFPPPGATSAPSTGTNPHPGDAGRGATTPPTRGGGRASTGQSHGAQRRSARPPGSYPQAPIVFRARSAR